MGLPYIHCAGCTLPILVGWFLTVTTFLLLIAGRLGVLTIWGGLTEPLAPVFMASLLFLSREREREREVGGGRKKCQFVPNHDAYIP